MDLHVKPGELLAVVGHVGAGKSSLIQAVLGEMDKLDGNVTICVSVEKQCMHVVACLRCLQRPLYVHVHSVLNYTEIVWIPFYAACTVCARHNTVLLITFSTNTAPGVR